ncbi:hypothetical protein ALC60_05379 [Trachymyrmex zeteki]|uniref:Uncharacterized protein n=1 Tax=Mycetomoellerius zeteki TaxID=64791 RepID=A0A151X5U1_9HYME|nr:hypothetical protein ALC60_05379 [Trachymyrmex zeteki]
MYIPVPGCRSEPDSRTRATYRRMSVPCVVLGSRRVNGSNVGPFEYVRTEIKFLFLTLGVKVSLWEKYSLRLRSIEVTRISISELKCGEIICLFLLYNVLYTVFVFLILLREHEKQSTKRAKRKNQNAKVLLASIDRGCLPTCKKLDICDERLMRSIMNLERCKLNKKPDADRVDICYAESNLQRAQVCHYSLVVIRTVLNHSNYHRVLGGRNGARGDCSAKNGAVRNRFENQSRTIKRRERSKTGVKNTEEEEEEKEWKAGREEPRFVGEVEEDEEPNEEGGSLLQLLIMISCDIRMALRRLREISRNDGVIKPSTSFRVFPRISCALAKGYAKYEGGGQQQQMDDQCATKFVDDRVNIFRETTPTRPPSHSRVQRHLSGNVQRGACGSPAGGRMRATAAKERKKRKELLGGGRTPSLCPRHHHRSRVVVPRRRRGPTGKRQRRAPSGVGGGGTSGEGGENATRHCSRRGGATYGW